MFHRNGSRPFVTHVLFWNVNTLLRTAQTNFRIFLVKRKLAFHNLKSYEEKALLPSKLRFLRILLAQYAGNSVLCFIIIQTGDST